MSLPSFLYILFADIFINVFMLLLFWFETFCSLFFFIKFSMFPFKGAEPFSVIFPFPPPIPPQPIQGAEALENPLRRIR